jgi:hypothetical protein
MINFKLPADGTYLIHLGDTQNNGGLDCGYRLRIGPSQPDFALRVTPSGISARAGATIPITVYALRKDGFTDSINLKLAGAPAGFSLSGARIPAGKDKLTLTMTMPYTPSREPVMLNMVGTSVINRRSVSRRAVPAEDMMQAFLYRHLVTAENWMVVASKRGQWSPPWKLDKPGLLTLTPGKTAIVRLTGNRAFGASQLQLELKTPPSGVSIGKITHGARGAFSFELKIDPAKARPGDTGNLMISAFIMRANKGKDGKKRPPRRQSMGFLPAVPFKIQQQ